MAVLTKPQTRSAAIRDRLNHPVIDTDVHTIEFLPTYLEYLEQIGGKDVVEHFVTLTPSRSWVRWHSMRREERRANRAKQLDLQTSNCLNRTLTRLPSCWRSRKRQHFHKAILMKVKVSHAQKVAAPKGV